MELKVVLGMVVALSMTSTLNDLVGLFMGMIMLTGKIIIIWGLLDFSMGLRSAEANHVPRAMKTLIAGLLCWNMPSVWGVIRNALGGASSGLAYVSPISALTQMQLTYTGIMNSFVFFIDISNAAVVLIGVIMVIMDLYDVIMSLLSHDHTMLAHSIKHMLASLLCVSVVTVTGVIY